MVLAVCGGQLAEAIDFNREIRPILSDNCYFCHGPDPEFREAELRLDQWSHGDGQAASDVIEPGDPDSSTLIYRIESEDEFEVMPPADSGKHLTAEQKKLLREWITAGAPFTKHWAFEAPQRPPLPGVKDNSHVQNPIDRFVLARLEQERLTPSPRADELRLLRRLYLDLIGLPPTLEDVEEFQRRPKVRAYAETVDRLLASPHYGERWGRVWLDVARYADSDGYEKDLPRSVWMYRDWVVNALNHDMPYNEFIIEQIGGDLLPNATQNERIATGFLRNSMVNREGGIDPEQFRMEGMFDRMDAVGKAVLGLTIQCAQCHTHKYDPLTHTEYYQMLAMLNNCHEAEIAVFTDRQRKQRDSVLAQIDELERELREQNPQWRQQMQTWEESLLLQEENWTILRPELDSSGGQKHYLMDDGSVLAQGYSPPQITSTFKGAIDPQKITAIKLELLNDPNLPRGGPGRSKIGLCALSEVKASVADASKPGETNELKFRSATADVNPPKTKLPRTADDGEKPDRFFGPAEFAIDNDDLTAWSIDIGPGRSNVPREAVFLFKEPVELSGPMELAVTLVQKHGGRRIDSPENFNLGRFRISVTAASDPHANPIPPHVREILEIAPEERTGDEVAQLFSYWRTRVPAWQQTNDQIEKLWQQFPESSSQLVVQQRENLRITHRLERGNFLNQAESVSPGVPSFLHPIKAESPTRLDFARWLADRRSPTTARVLVNRIWQQYFGTGLVATSEDFGLQGDPPSNQDLLDWLAVELMDNGWSQKHIHRLIVQSATYQQSSVATPELLERDPTNRLLARGPRFRAEAEIVRDIALAASGLLHREIGGPPVYPPAPRFLFEQPASYEPKVWDYSEGSEKYRRALYTFRFRSVPYPVLETFDAPSGTVACARRVRSNTPMQALATLNEPLFMECATALADEVLEISDATEEERIESAFRRCVTRPPKPEELSVLTAFLDEQKQQLVDSPAEGQGGATAEQRAWTALARVILNLDETISVE